MSNSFTRTHTSMSIERHGTIHCGQVLSTTFILSPQIIIVIPEMTPIFDGRQITDDIMRLGIRFESASVHTIQKTCDVRGRRSTTYILKGGNDKKRLDFNFGAKL